MRALMLRGVVVELAPDEFPVAAGFSWRAAPDGCAPGWVVQDGALVAPTEPVASLDDERIRARRRITDLRDDALTKLTVEFDGALFDANETSVQRMTSALGMWERAVAAGDPRAPDTIAWLGADNRQHTLSRTDLTELAGACWLAQQAVWARNNAAKAAIESAADVAAVRAIAF